MDGHAAHEAVVEGPLQGGGVEIALVSAGDHRVRTPARSIADLAEAARVAAAQVATALPYRPPQPKT